MCARVRFLLQHCWVRWTAWSRRRESRTCSFSTAWRRLRGACRKGRTPWRSWRRSSSGRRRSCAGRWRTWSCSWRTRRGSSSPTSTSWMWVVSSGKNRSVVMHVLLGHCQCLSWLLATTSGWHYRFLSWLQVSSQAATLLKIVLWMGENENVSHFLWGKLLLEAVVEYTLLGRCQCLSWLLATTSVGHHHFFFSWLHVTSQAAALLNVVGWIGENEMCHPLWAF